MDIENVVKNIKSIYEIVSGKQEADVFLIYRGFANGITKPWIIRIEAREFNHETHEGALNGLLDSLRQELIKKAASTEQESMRLKKAIAAMGN